MKKLSLLICLWLGIGHASPQSAKDKDIIKDSNDAKAAFSERDPALQSPLKMEAGLHPVYPARIYGVVPSLQRIGLTRKKK